MTKLEIAATLDIMDMMSDFEDFKKQNHYKISVQKDLHSQNRDFDLKS